MDWNNVFWLMVAMMFGAYGLRPLDAFVARQLDRLALWLLHVVSGGRR